MACHILPQHRTMLSELERKALRRAVFHGDYGLLRSHRFPLTIAPVLQRIRRIELLDVEILLIHREDRKSPRDVLVVSNGDTWKGRFAGADHIPPWCTQMHDVTQRRKRNHAMRIIRQYRLAGRGKLAGNGPVIAAHGGAMRGKLRSRVTTN